MTTLDTIALDISDRTRQFVANDDPGWAGRRHGDACRSTVALDCGSFQVWRGEILGVLGARCSGKSTLVRHIAALLAADDDRVTISGHDVLRDRMALRRLINPVLADVALFRRLTPVENLIYGARLHGLGQRKARECAVEVLRQLGLNEETVFRPTGELSAPIQQRVAAACASLTQPVLLLLDEPMAGLAPRSRWEVRSFIRELRDVYDATILLTTRDAREADALCDRVAVLDEGRIVALDTPAGLRDLVSRTDGCAPTLQELLIELASEQWVPEVAVAW